MNRIEAVNEAREFERKQGTKFCPFINSNCNVSCICYKPVMIEDFGKGDFRAHDGKCTYPDHR